MIAVAVFVALLTGIWLLTMRVQPESKLEVYKKSLRERGEKLEINEVLPPAVPAASNCVDAVEEAFRMLGSRTVNTPYVMRMVAPGRAMLAWTQPDVRGSEFTNSWEDFTADIAADQPARELLADVLERPELDFHLDYQKGFLLLLPHLAPFKRSAQSLSAAAICDLHQGNPGLATTNLMILLGLVQADQNEHVLISQLVRIAMAAIAVSPTWELLQSTNVTDAQLAALQTSWETLEFVSCMEGPILMERAMASAMIKKLRSSHTEFNGLMSMGTLGSSGGTSSAWPPDFDEWVKAAKSTTGEIMWRASWSYSEELHMLQADQIMLETLRTMQTNRFYQPDYDAMRTRLSALGVTNAGAAIFRALDIPDFSETDFSETFDHAFLSATVSKAIRAEAARRIVVTAIALKRFQLRHGEFPASLSELTPDLLPSVPVDPVDGKPLRYRLNADGTYTLYSVGEDGVDDGGDPTSLASGSPGLYWQGNKVRDWVWPQPATAEEIEFFHEHPPK